MELTTVLLTAIVIQSVALIFFFIKHLIARKERKEDKKDDEVASLRVDVTRLEGRIDNHEKWVKSISGTLKQTTENMNRISEDVAVLTALAKKEERRETVE